MVVTMGIGNPENKRNFLKKGRLRQVKTLCFEIMGDLKSKPINTCLKSVCLKQRLVRSPIEVGRDGAENLPGGSLRTRGHDGLTLKADLHSGSRSAAVGIKNMRAKTSQFSGSL